MSQFQEYKHQARIDAKKVLEKAKQQEAEKLASGAKLKRLNDKTLKLSL